MSLSITDLFIYPVKSLRGIRVERALLDVCGLENDRRWMIIDHDNKFVSQRRLPALATLQTELSADQLRIKSSHSECVIHREFSGEATLLTATIWADSVQVVDEGESVSRWLTDALDSSTPLRLVRLAHIPRPMSKPQYLGTNTHTVFADMAPLLVVNQASLDQLNSALSAKGEAPVPMNRFRPNIVIQGLEAFGEHKLAGISNGELKIHFAYPCERCVMPSIDQITGHKHPQLEPYGTLKEINSMPAYGKGEHHKPANPKAAAFGENAYIKNGQSHLLLVGDIFQELENEQ